MTLYPPIKSMPDSARRMDLAKKKDEYAAELLAGHEEKLQKEKRIKSQTRKERNDILRKMQDESEL